MPRVPDGSDPVIHPPITCNKCDETKTIDQFRRYKPNFVYGHCKACESDKNKANYEKNKERVLARQKERRKADPGHFSEIQQRSNRKHSETRKEYHKKYKKTEKWKQYYKSWRTKNSEHIKIHQSEYRKNNLEKVRGIEANYYARNQDKKADYRRRWAKANPIKWAIRCARYSHRRRSRSADVPNDLTADQWIEIVRSQDNRCYYCGTPFGLFLSPTKDHVIPLTKGGGLTKSNIVAACQPCNSSKGTKIIDRIAKRRRRPSPRIRPRGLLPGFLD